MTPEGRVKHSIKKILNTFSVWYYMPVSFGMGATGVPDFLCCIAGKFFAIEAKAGSNTPTKLQSYVHQQIRSAGAQVFVINETNLQEITDYLTRQQQDNR